ncbi:MAG: hypothetical protein ACRDUV_00580 [Pseudonocardiaceae bacterium]
MDLDAAQRLVARYSGGADRTFLPVAALDRASQARLLSTLQHLYGNAAVQRIVDASLGPAVQRDRVYHDKRAALSWKDFKGKVTPGSPLSAETIFGSTALRLEGKAVKNGAVWDAEAWIDPSSLNLRGFMERGKSWVRKAKKSADLLRHEQGHFDIHNILVEKGEVAIKAVAAGVKGSASDPKQKKALKDAADQLTASAPFTKLSSTKSVLRQAQHDYDEDPTKGTDHGTKAAEQAQWEADIIANLPAYPIP